MEKITQLVHSLSNREVKLYYKYAALSGKKRNNLKIKLFEIAKQNRGISDIEAAAELGKKPDAAFSMLKSRLQTDILKVLVFDGDESRFFAKALRARYKVFKLMAETLILENRNLRLLSLDTIKKAEGIAKQYELASAKVLISEFLLNSHFASKGPAVYSRFKENAFRDFDNQIDNIKAQDYVKQLNIPTLFNANTEKSKLELARNASNELTALAERNPSARIRFFYLRSQLEVAELNQKFEDQNKFALEFLDLVLHTDAVRSSDNIGGGYMLVALSYLHLRDFERTIEYCQRGDGYFFKNSANEITLNSVRFRGYLGSNQLDKAAELVKQVRELKTIKRGSFNYSRWLYFDANMKFLSKDFTAALNMLKRHSFLKSDRSGWRLGYKILEMMCIVEMNHYDWLPYRLETFRKLLSDIKKENTARPKLIQKILMRLVKENFDFERTAVKMKEQLALLRGNTGEYYCEPLGYEVIRFDIWWDEKIAARNKRKSA